MSYAPIDIGLFVRIATKSIEDIQMEFKIAEKKNSRIAKDLRDQLLRERKNFEKQFADQNNQQKTTFTNLSKNFNNQLDAVKGQSLKALNHVNLKADDPFYQLRRPQPSIKDIGDSYEIRLEVPPHEEKSYILSAEKRQLQLTFNRQYKDQLKQDGEELTSSRIESFNYTLPVEFILDPNKITKNYENNVLTFKIAKA
jgi:HSP20 family molecular chaperone IbpA